MSYTVYAIRCKENGKMYIGRTGEASLEERYKKHRYRLNKGICYSKSLQKDWNKYGQAAFEITPVIDTDDYEYSKRLEKIVSIMFGTNDDAFGYNKQDPTFSHGRTVGYKRKITDNAEDFLKKRIMNAISGDINELSNKTGYSQKEIENWRSDPLSIRAVDLIRLENVTGVMP